MDDYATQQFVWNVREANHKRKCLRSPTKQIEMTAEEAVKAKETVSMEN
jgi:hypothetical protein